MKVENFPNQLLKVILHKKQYLEGKYFYLKFPLFSNARKRAKEGKKANQIDPMKRETFVGMYEVEIREHLSLSERSFLLFR